MKRLIAAALVLLLTACSPAAKTASGKVLVRAAVEQYQPAVGAACRPTSGELLIFTDDRTYRVPLEDGTVTYPSGKPEPGEQWCSVPFSVQIASSGSAFIAQVGTGSVLVPTETLYSAAGVSLMLVAGSLVVV